MSKQQKQAAQQQRTQDPAGAQAQQAAKDAARKSIDPKDIKFDTDEDDDSDMPKPPTKEYKRYIKCSDKFMELLHKCVDTLPYMTVLRNDKGNRMRLVDFVKFLEANRGCVSINDMNVSISYIAQLDFQHARPLMEVVEDKDLQGELWSLLPDE